MVPKNEDLIFKTKIGFSRACKAYNLEQWVKPIAK
jgi:hypothetical protein